MYKNTEKLLRIQKLVATLVRYSCGMSAARSASEAPYNKYIIRYYKDVLYGTLYYTTKTKDRNIDYNLFSIEYDIIPIDSLI